MKRIVVKMSKEEMLAEAWKDKTDCIEIDFMLEKIIFYRRNIKAELELTTSNLIEMKAELLDKVIKQCPSDLRVASLFGGTVFGRSKGFNKVIKEMGIKDDIKSLAELLEQ